MQDASKQDQRGQSLPDLVAIMQRLLGEGGCPWDREQTQESLRPYVIEEAFEVVDAIDRGSPELLRVIATLMPVSFSKAVTIGRHHSSCTVQ